MTYNGNRHYLESSEAAWRKKRLSVVHTGCRHGSKLTQGNAIRCANCNKIVGFVRVPK